MIQGRGTGNGEFIFSSSFTCRWQGIVLRCIGVVRVLTTSIQMNIQAFTSGGLRF